MGEVWRGAGGRIAEFDVAAVAYDRLRPRYPEPLFDDFITLDGLARNDRVVEIGAGTGIATVPLLERGLRVTAIEPSPAMADLLKAKIGTGVLVVLGRFEQAPIVGPVELVAAFNSWHWVDPAKGVERLAELLHRGGLAALVWTQVTSWGQDPFAERLAELSGGPWPTRFPEIVRSKDVVENDSRFAPLGERQYRFQRALDAHAFVEVTKTYGGHLSDHVLREVEDLINNEFDGTVTKVEEASVYTYQRS